MKEPTEAIVAYNFPKIGVYEVKKEADGYRIWIDYSSSPFPAFQTVEEAMNAIKKEVLACVIVDQGKLLQQIKALEDLKSQIEKRGLMSFTAL